MNACCFSINGDLIYTGSSDNTIREWESVAPFKCLSIIIGHYAPVQGVAFATRCVDVGVRDVRVASPIASTEREGEREVGEYYYYYYYYYYYEGGK